MSRSRLDPWRILVAALGICVLCANRSLGAAGVDAVSYSHHVWQSAEGLPEDLAQAITSTPDGYLWIGTSGGLVRFDGYRFTLYNHETEAAIVEDSVYSLLRSRDGTLWAGTEGGGLLHYRQGSFRSFGAKEGLANGFVRSIFEDRSGRLWVGTDAGLFRLEGDSFVRIDGRPGLPAMSVHSICEDSKGRLLVGGWGLLILDGPTATYYASAESHADNSIRAIRETSDGVVWVGTISGLRRLAGGIQGNPFHAPKTISGANISTLLEGRGGELWIGTYGRGLMRRQGERVDRFSAPMSLPHNNVLALFEDAEANVWVGTQGGLLRLSPCAASTLTASDGAPLSINAVYEDSDGTILVTALDGRLFRVTGPALELVTLKHLDLGLRIRNVFRDKSGALWIGTDGQGAVRMGGGRSVRYTMTQGLVNDFVRAFCEERDGSIWIGTDGGLSRWRLGRLEAFTAESQAESSIRVLLVDRRDRLWVATEGGVSRFENGAVVRDRALAPLRGQKVWALHEDPEGGLWIGTQGSGLFVLKEGVLTRFTTKQGLPSDKIHFLAEDRQGSLWMSGPRGVASISRADLERVARDSSRQLAVRLYTTAEGLRTNQMNGGVQPAGLLDSTGDLWFPSTKGLVRVAPGVPEQTSVPPVLIERVIADDREVPLSEQLHLEPGEGKLEIHYTAMRLRSPERIRFRYWMEGFDRTWTDAGQRRVAFYTNLPAGHYRFHVSAHEMNAPEESSEGRLAIEWQPHFYQTGWFLALCAAAALTLAWASYRVHLGNLRRRFAAVLDERNRLAREMHDTLIQGCLGVSTLLEAASRAHEVSPKLGTDLLDRARDEVRATVTEARTAIWNLRHGGPSGEEWIQAVVRLAERSSAEAGMPVHCESEGSPFALDGEVERSLSLVLREAIHNAATHAAPANVWVRLRFDRRHHRIEVEDDGCGFDPAAGREGGDQHYGLIGMRERVASLGGTFGIESARGSGTKIRLKIPAAPPTGRTETPRNLTDGE